MENSGSMAEKTEYLLHCKRAGVLFSSAHFKSSGEAGHINSYLLSPNSYLKIKRGEINNGLGN